MCFLVFDIETEVDEELIYNTHCKPNEPLESVMKRFYEDYTKKDGDTPFIPAQYQYPTAIAYIAINRYARLVAHKVLSCEDPRWLTKEHWALLDLAKRSEMNGGLGVDQFVTYNGRGFDFPVMEAQALRWGVSLKDWLVLFPRYNNEDPRARWNNVFHIDLMTLLVPLGRHMPLNYWTRLVGLPGKVGMDGSQVSGLVGTEEGRAKLEDYCMCDVLNTAGLLIAVLRASGDSVQGVFDNNFAELVNAIAEEYPDGNEVQRWAHAYRQAKSRSETDQEPPF